MWRLPIGIASHNTSGTAVAVTTTAGSPEITDVYVVGGTSGPLHGQPRTGTGDLDLLAAHHVELVEDAVAEDRGRAWGPWICAQ